MKTSGNDIVADTSAVIELYSGNKKIKDAFRRARHVFLPFVVRAELLYGALISGRTPEEMARLETLFLASSPIASDSKIERAYAQIKSDLKKKGRKIPDNDIWVAACSVARSLPLLSLDRHFVFVDKLTLLMS